MIRQRRSATRALILGVSPLASKLIDALDADPGYELLGVVAERRDSPQVGHGLPILGTVTDFNRIVKRVEPDLIVVALADRRGSFPLKRLLECSIQGRIEVADGQAVYEQLTGALEVAALTPADVLFSRELRPSHWRLLSTRVLGVSLALIALLIMSPVAVLIAIAIKLNSRGPALFVQERIGAFGRPFKLFKFRTMGPAEGPTSEWVRDNHGRITRLGAWLRKFRLDELPQLVNILRGDMNLVGPRPHPVGSSEILTMLARNLCDVSGIDVPYYSLRCRVRPGITGWAQVRYGYANDFAEELEKLRYDLYYVKHMSVRHDCRILLETIKVVVRGQDSCRLSRSGLSTRLSPLVPRALTRKLA